MADDDEEGLSPVDQGTLLMLCLSLGMGILAGFWFGCKWYKKRAKKENQEVRIHRPRLKQTFSRFSQVDEELTMHNIDEHDVEILQSYTATPGNAKPKQPTDTTQTRVTVTESKKPYLETDI